MKLRKLRRGIRRRGRRDPPDFGEVWDAFFASQVLVFRNQRFTPAEFLASRASSAGPSRTSSTSSTIPSMPTS